MQKLLLSLSAYFIIISSYAQFLDNTPGGSSPRYLKADINLTMDKVNEGGAYGYSYQRQINFIKEGQSSPTYGINTLFRYSLGSFLHFGLANSYEGMSVKDNGEVWFNHSGIGRAGGPKVIFGTPVQLDAGGIVMNHDFTVQHKNLNITYGQLRIGSGLPNKDYSPYKVIVDGQILCEELLVQLSEDWPDYVFTPSYNLMTLSATEKYIKLNNHLPNIPSASEVAENGIPLGEMSKLQMEKIEELTLYIIELNKQKEALEKKMIDNKTETTIKLTTLEERMKVLEALLNK